MCIRDRRKALGAEPYQIQAQFLIESFLLSFFGGVLGLAVGTLTVKLFSAYADIAGSITLSSAILGLGFSGLIGILFGWAPARKAKMCIRDSGIRAELVLYLVGLEIGLAANLENAVFRHR